MIATTEQSAAVLWGPSLADVRRSTRFATQRRVEWIPRRGTRDQSNVPARSDERVTVALNAADREKTGSWMTQRLVSKSCTKTQRVEQPNLDSVQFLLQLSFLVAELALRLSQLSHGRLGEAHVLVRVYAVLLRAGELFVLHCNRATLESAKLAVTFLPHCCFAYLPNLFVVDSFNFFGEISHLLLKLGVLLFKFDLFFLVLCWRQCNFVEDFVSFFR